MEIKGYKAFNKGLINRYGEIFEEGKTYEKNITPRFGNHGSGYHFCRRLEDTLHFFPSEEEEIDIAQITALGDIAEGEDDYGGFYEMYSTNKIRIDHILTREEILKMYLRMEPNERVKRFIHYFKMDEIELACFQKRMVDDQPKTIITYGLQGPNSVTYSHTYIVEQIEDEIKRSLERNKKIESVGYQKQKLK